MALNSRKRSKRKMTDERLLALIQERASKCDDSARDADAEKGIDYYLGKPLGNEVPDRSAVVVRELFGTIEWIMPALMRMYFGTDAPVLFSPRTKDDAKQAEQETDYVNYVIADKNDGFEVLYSWFKDALMARNSYTVADWCKRQDVTETTYENLTLEQATMMLMNGELELLESEVVEEVVNGEPVELYTLKVREVYSDEFCRVSNVPAERVKIQENLQTVSLRDANFVSYWQKESISALREMGYKVDDDLSDDDDEMGDADGVDESRGVDHDSEDDDSDPASREVTVRYTYIRCDYDGDGISELRKIIHVGKEILSNEISPLICMASITPMIMPNRHQGISYYDALKDLQDIQTTLMRGILDNTYLANNGRFAADETTVDLDDLMESRPGSITRVKGSPMDKILPLTHPSMAANGLQVMEYITLMSENRTGASPRAMQGQAIDGNAINQTASGMSQIMNAAMSRVELVARVFAETGVKDLFMIVHMLTRTHQRMADMVELRNEWVEVDPREWKRRFNMKVQVGLGTGSKDSQISKLQMLIAAMPNMMPMNLVTPHHMYNAFAKLIDLMGWKNVSEFIQDPADPRTPAPPQQPPDPKILVEQAKVANEAEKNKRDAMLKEMDIKANVQIAQMNTQSHAQAKWLDSQNDIAKFIVQQDGADEGAGATIVDSPDQMPQEAMAHVLALLQGMQKPRRRRFVHQRGPDGRIAATEEIED